MKRAINGAMLSTSLDVNFMLMNFIVQFSDFNVDLKWSPGGGGGGGDRLKIKISNKLIKTSGHWTLVAEHTNILNVELNHLLIMELKKKTKNKID